METTNKLLNDIATRLDESTQKNWDRGDVDDWAKFGRKMWNTIDSVTPILKTLATTPCNQSTPVSTDKEQKIIMTDKQYVINELIDKGWKVISVTPPSPTCGEFCFLLEK